MSLLDNHKSQTGRRNYDNRNGGQSGGKDRPKSELFLNPGKWVRSPDGSPRFMTLKNGIGIDGMEDMPVSRNSTADWRAHARFANEERDKLIEMGADLGAGERRVIQWAGTYWELKRNGTPAEVSDEDTEGWQAVDSTDISPEELEAYNNPQPADQAA